MAGYQRNLERERLCVAIIAEDMKFDLDCIPLIKNQLQAISPKEEWFKIIVYNNRMKKKSAVVAENLLGTISCVQYVKSHTRFSDYDMIKDEVLSFVGDCKHLMFIGNGFVFKPGAMKRFLAYYVGQNKKESNTFVGIGESVVAGYRDNFKKVSLFKENWSKGNFRYILLDDNVSRDEEVLTFSTVNVDKTENITFSVSVLCFNRLDRTKECVDSIFKSKNLCGFELILTDNGSSDETRKYIKGLDDKRIVKIYHDKNIGFARGNNYASHHANGKYLAILNNDITVPDGWLDDLRSGFSDQNVRCVGTNPTTLGKDGGGCHVPPDKEYEYIEGSCMAIPLDFVRKEGLFDPDFHILYSEDVDLSFRVKVLGFDLAVVPIKLRHRRKVLSHHIMNKEEKEGVQRSKEVLFKKWGKYIKSRDFTDTNYDDVKINPLRIAVYTAITAKKDLYSEPEFKEDGVDYFLFDDKNIPNTKKFNKDILKAVEILPEKDRQHGTNLLRASKVRVLAPILLLDKSYDFTIWHDGSIQVVGSVRNLVNGIIRNNALLYMYGHPYRNCVYEEIKDWNKYNRYYKTSRDRTLKRYQDDSFPVQYGLWGGAVQIRDHRNEMIDKYLKLLWEDIVKVTLSDQLSIPYLLRKYQFPFKTINRQFGDEHNRFFKYRGHRW